jgi:hypothetical protein
MTRTQQGTRARASSLIRTLRALTGAELRAAYVVDAMRTAELGAFAPVLDEVCARAEQAEEGACEALVAVVDAFNTPSVGDVVQQLREQAAGDALLALDRLLHRPTEVPRASAHPANPEDDRVPDYGKGRPLTLGERKALARRPDRDTMQRLMLDPHPDVIRALLTSPRITEADVVRLAAKRPSRGDVLTEIARSIRWSHRVRVRLTLALNPDTPLEISLAFVGLLLRQELELVASATHVAPAVRAACLAHLERRPPVEKDDADSSIH